MQIKTIAAVAKHKQQIKRIKEVSKKLGLKYSEKNPDLIISIGGDGTFLFAERIYPEIPKILVKDSEICNKRSEKDLISLLNKVIGHKIKIRKYPKLEATFKNKKYYCTNEFSIRNKLPTEALRFAVKVNGRYVDGMLIGDGIVISTNFGSSAYFYAITKKSFSKGIGMAFNNVVQSEIKHKILPESSKIEIEIIRKEAHLAIDNSPKILTLNPGDKIIIKKSNKTTKVAILGKNT